ncbi:F-box protein GID2 [Tripterygium wilfordii]|uniref:F-box protein GID2 n=1 Tax=Tripterygium wilfordii TaxID=458696 RepID=A0A7J7CPU3_TRIWF|nr:F-box protein GID2-like [Tripterygium wilfordii]KAF5736081.1 F-box protein GID2 [Tripterygium wilfordii]
MKRGLTDGEFPVNGDDDTNKMKRIKQEDDGDDEEEEGVNKETGFVHLDENLLFEVLKHVDARTLGRAACVNSQWHRTALDERLWELICTRHSPNIGCGNQQLRSVVLALGGFRRLHSSYLWPLSKPQSSSIPVSAPSTSSSWAPLAPMIGAKPSARWGRDEVHLSLSLLSIRYYEKMNFGDRNR